MTYQEINLLFWQQPEPRKEWLDRQAEPERTAFKILLALEGGIGGFIGFWDTLDGDKHIIRGQFRQRMSKNEAFELIKKQIGEKLPTAPELAGTYPLVIYLGSKAEADKLIAAIRLDRPNMIVRAL